MEIIRASSKQKHGHGPFNIEILFPGISLGMQDTGFYTIGRIDHANFRPPGFVPMHWHRNDEIFSYMRTGEQIHKDTTGRVEHLDSSKMMMMNAGSGIQHEEEAVKAVEMLQIFMRPSKNGLEPKVQFNQFDEIYSHDKWRLLAGDAADAPLELRSPTNIYDARVAKGNTIKVPAISGVTNFLYCFEGTLHIGNEEIYKGDSVIFSDNTFSIEAQSQVDLVLFQIENGGVYSDTGMFSGNQYK